MFVINFSIQVNPRCYKCGVTSYCPNPGGHTDYQDTFVSDFLKFYPDPFALPKSTWDYIVQFWYLDLSQTDSIMQECYSVFGSEPRLPSCMLPSYLLALRLKVTSITVWCRMLKETPLYAILSSFSFGGTPGIRTFYGFFSRIWQDGKDNLSPKDRLPKMNTDFSARPVYLQDENRIKAHFLICFLALTLYRFLEKKLDYKYTCGELLDTLKAMNFAEIQEQGFIPLYRRELIRDDLHEVCGFRTDYPLITKNSMRTIQKKSKGKE